MTDMEYAVVDIETTGGHASAGRITEICIIITDGITEKERWNSLVNPLQQIPLHITALTGISNEMVEYAPVFKDLASQIFQLLHNRIFVAHNVNFDFSFLQHQLAESGFIYQAKKLCTVRLSRKLFPGFPSYSLGRLCDSLAIPLQDRHRAEGDASATVILFHQILSKDETGEVEKILKKGSKLQQLPSQIPAEEYAALPNVPGIYYFLNKSGKIVYIGKAVNLKERVFSHFSGNVTTAKRQHFLREIHHITFEECGNELISLLMECIEIKKHWPVYNDALKKFEPKFGLIHYQGTDNYSYLAIARLAKGQSCIQSFDVENDGIQTLLSLAHEHEVNLHFCKFKNQTKSTETESPKEDRNTHNQRVETLINSVQSQENSFYIWGKGRNLSEKSCIWVEKGRLYGIGYLDSALDFPDDESIKSSLNRHDSNYYMMQLIYNYASKHPQSVVYIKQAYSKNAS